MNRFSSAPVPRIIVAATAWVLALAACERGADTGMAPSSARTEPGAATTGAVTVRVHAGGRYLVEGDAQPVTLAHLADHLRARRRAFEGNGTLTMLAYRGTTGYDVVLAVNAARQAGFSRIEGIADYDDSGSPQSTAKRWVQDLASAGPPVTAANDTPHRTR